MPRLKGRNERQQVDFNIEVCQDTSVGPREGRGKVTRE